MKLRYQLLAILLFFIPISNLCAEIEIPKVHSNIIYNDSGKLIYVDTSGTELEIVQDHARYTLEKMRSQPIGTDNGISFDFQDSTLSGKLYYGFMVHTFKIRHPYPVFFKRSAKITKGKAEINIKEKMIGKYDFVDWQNSSEIRLGYRIVNETGRLLYDGKIMIKGTGPFVVDTSIIEGPFINKLTPEGATISYITNFPIPTKINTELGIFTDDKPVTHHEITLTGLPAGYWIDYQIVYGSNMDNHYFFPAPEPGSRRHFTFAYASDGRGNNGGGERDIKGVNAYILKKIAVLCKQKKVRFFQFTGDMIDGYATDIGEIELEYANWKRTVEPFASYFPFICSFGNHESLMNVFSDGTEWGVAIDKFPFETESSEAIFARNFVNPENGPLSEDGSEYDPQPDKTDFPPYKETVFYYTYDNVAIISANSNYWYAPSIEEAPEIGGNLHGYIMDNQLQWLKKTLEMFEQDQNIDHVFVTFHTPIFPNGGHVSDDMWYDGNNKYRPTIAGIAVKKGIIERRDELLDILMNQSSKVRATLTGDEHNYSLLRVTDSLPIYPESYQGKKLEKFRSFWHINNGAAGAPYYGKETTPWQDYVEEFSTQNAVVFFHVNGMDVEVEVINPDTGELIDRFTL